MLALSQSAVSAALTDLEGQLGVQLFDRVGKRLVVNGMGGCSTRGRWHCLNRRLKSNKLFRGDNGAIRIYASSTIGPTIFCRKSSPVIAMIIPELPMELSVGNSLRT